MKKTVDKDSAPRSSRDGFMASTTKYGESSRGSFSGASEFQALQRNQARGVTKALLCRAELGRPKSDRVARKSAESKEYNGKAPRFAEALPTCQDQRRTRYLAARRASRHSPGLAAELLERRRLADWVALYSPRAAKVLRSRPAIAQAKPSEAT